MSIYIVQVSDNLWVGKDTPANANPIEHPEVFVNNKLDAYTFKLKSEAEFFAVRGKGRKIIKITVEPKKSSICKYHQHDLCTANWCQCECHGS
jgi:hypothetical protein